jgi:hypothetical protein
MTATLSRDLQDRLRNLKTLSEQGATEGESLAAAAALQRLLFKHNLSLADVSTDEPSAYEREDYGMGVTRGSSRWQWILLHVVAKANFCQAVAKANASTRRSSLIGEPHNLEITKALFEYLRREALRLCPKGQGPAFRRSFFVGFAARVGARLKAQQQEDAVTYTGGSALVVAKERDLALAVRGFYSNLGKGRSASVSNAEGYYAGQRAGAGVNLSRSIGYAASSQRALA